MGCESATERAQSTPENPIMRPQIIHISPLFLLAACANQEGAPISIVNEITNEIVIEDDCCGCEDDCDPCDEEDPCDDDDPC